MVLTVRIKGKKEEIERAIFSLQWRGFNVKTIEEGDDYAIVEIKNAFLRCEEGLFGDETKKKLEEIQKKLEGIQTEVRKIGTGETGGLFFLLLENAINLAIDICRIAHMTDSFVRMESFDIGDKK